MSTADIIFFTTLSVGGVLIALCGWQFLREQKRLNQASEFKQHLINLAHQSTRYRIEHFVADYMVSWRIVEKLPLSELCDSNRPLTMEEWLTEEEIEILTIHLKDKENDAKTE